MKKYEICLINPPLCVNEYPHLALPVLKAYLVSKGFKNIIIKDFNAPIMNRIIRNGFSKVEDYFNEREMSITREEVENNYDEARRSLKDEYSARDERAYKLINTYLRIAGSNIFDICFCPDNLQKIKDAYDSFDLEEDNIIIRYIKEEILEYIKGAAPKVIGISIPFTSQIFYGLVIGRCIKKMLPEVRIVMGGPQISLFAMNFLSYLPFREAFDDLIVGLGEVALEEYITAVLSNKSSKEVPNLAYIDSNGKFTVTEEKNLNNINLIPIPDFTDLNLNDYIYPKLPYQISRGCYWSRCSFCSYRDTKGYIVKERRQIVDDMKQIKRLYGIHNIQFIDDAIRPDILQEFAEILIEEKVNIKYEAYLRLDRNFTFDVCQMLAKSGLRSVLFGFESASQRVLNLMNKGTTPELIKEVLYNMKSAGIQNILSCLIGFPTETEEEAWESIRFLEENKDIYYHVFIVHFGMISDMKNHYQEFGVEYIDFSNLERYDDTGFVAIGYPYTTKSGMTPKEALEVIRAGRDRLNIKIFKDNFFS